MRQRNIGQNKGRPRIWLEGAILTECGFNHGDRFNVSNKPDKMIIKRDPIGERKIAGNADRPIIDMTGKVIEASFNCEKISRVNVNKIRDGLLHITPCEA